jgi:hypothetical protein
MSDQIYVDGPLTLTLLDAPQEVRLKWEGQSVAREPASFVLPVLNRALEMGSGSRRPVIIDFQQLEYLNSSTITPVIRFLEQARRSNQEVTVVYRKDLKWQALSFTALELFRTPDHRIEVRGV